MKKKIFKLTTIVCLSLFFLGSTITAHASTESEALVDEGRALLFNNGNPTYSGLLAANEEFKAAVAADPSDQEANLFYAVTRLAVLLDNNVTYTADAPVENIKELLDGFGVDDDGRDIFNWTATVPEDAEGNIILPLDTPSGIAIQEFLQSVIIYEIDEALANLAVIENPFEIILTDTETGEDHDIEVDYGDVLLYKSLLHAAKAGNLILCSYDLNVDIDVIVDKINNEIFNINSDLLDAYPDFLKLLADGGTIIGAAKTAILEAIDNYDAASIYIRVTETDEQWNDLFTIDPEEEAKEADFRSHLADIKDSITNQQPVDMGDEEEVFPVDFSEFFDDPISIRNYLPGFTHDPYIDKILINGISSFPDRTFSGIFPDGVPSEEYDYIDKVVVWGGNSEGGQDSFILCYVNGLAPWDIESLTVYGPDGFRYDFDIEHDISTHYRFGTAYRYKVLGTLPEGWYHFVLKDKEGRDYHVEKHFTPNLINVVDMSAGASPADSAYVNTTTPTLSWASVTDETIGSLYYRIDIKDWNKQVTIYTSDRSPDTTVTVPDGFLEPNTAYKWQVQVFDSQDGISANNFSSSSWKSFSTGASGEPLAIERASVSSKISPDNDQTQLSIKIIGPAPWDVGSMTVTGPGGFSYTFNSGDLRQDGVYKHSEDGILPDGAYTFTVVDGRDGISTETVDKEFNFNRLPIPEHLFSPLYQYYIETTIPTFSWSPVTASSVYYRIKIFDYSGNTVYKSDRSTATTATVPADILKPNNPYYWRVEVFDADSAPQNCSTSWKWSFYVSKDNPVGFVSGQIAAGESGYTSGGTIYVAVYDGPLPDGNLVAYVALSDAGQYALYNLPVGTDLYVYVRWDADSDGSGSRTPGDWVGEYGTNPITITEGSNPTNINIALDNEVQATSISGQITCTDFETGHGQIYIGVFDGPDYNSDGLLGSTSITVPGAYTVSSLPVGSAVWVFAYWDANGSGSDGADFEDYTGSYINNPLTLSAEGNSGIYIDLTYEIPIEPTIKGDINGDRSVDLTDAILALQVMAGIEPFAIVYQEADVNGDDKIGMAEVIYILQYIAGLRQDFTPLAYSIEQVDNNEITEHRFMFNKHHFMTLIDDNGTLNLRPRPGVDVNGWGSSWYVQPFLPGAVLGHTIIDSLTADSEGIHVSASGGVSYGESSTYGTWSITMDFNYNAAEKKITGIGEYSIILDGTLTDTTGDLNLYKIASNYLDDVPLLSAGIGDTGDMKQADVVGDSFNFTWVPPGQPSYFPNDISDYLLIDVVGQYNNVDTEAQGYEPIEPAYKPSLKVILISQQAGLEMIFGGIYDWEKRQAFWEDNVGITPLILKQSTETEFRFNVEFESKALPGDGQ